MIMEEDKTRDFYGWVASILSIFFFLTLMPPIIKLFKEKIYVENFPGLFVTVIYVNCICWYIYGEMILSNQIKYCHLFGAIINFILIYIYLFYEIRKYPLDSILNGIIVIIGSYALYRGIKLNLNDDIQSVGYICLITHLFILLSPIVLIFKVVMQKNYNLIPIIPVRISLSATISWIAYGVYLFNINIIYPNIIGFILELILVIIYIVYSRIYQNINESEDCNTIGIENNENENKIVDEVNTIKIEDELQKKKKKPVKIAYSKEDN